MKLVHAKTLLAKAYVTMQQLYVYVDGIHQVLVYFWRYVIVIHCRFQRGIVFSSLRVEDQRLHLAVVKACKRIVILLVYGIHLFEGILPDVPVRAFHQCAVGTVRKANGFSLLVCHLRKLEICIVEDGERIGSHLAHLRRHCHQLFHLSGKHVCLHAADLIDIAAI